MYFPSRRIVGVPSQASKLGLPVALLVTIGLQALTALVLVHLETTLLFEITHD